MLSNQNLAGYATFSFDYFLNGGIISCTCPDCGSDIRLPIRIYQSGKLVEGLADVYGPQLIDELVEKRIVNIKDETSSVHSNLRKYILWNMDARYELISCKGCNNLFLSVFGMAELQPGREEVQFKGIWKIIR
ncbi:hypothetical protein [Fluviicola sp.]|uniref:hypothetical protein n=1 Tax=Fluviicola sp. TaxID=1917219 RepID=UPI0031D8E192